MKRRLSFLLLSFLFLSFSNQYAEGQEQLSFLVDSLSAAKDDKTFVDLSMKIASELKYEDRSRMAYYVELAKKRADSADEEDIWKSFYNRAFHIYSDLDALDAALNYLLKEYDYYKNTENLKKYEIENQLGVIHARLNNPDKALFYFKKILKHYQSEKNHELIGKTYNNIGLAYLSIENPDSSVYFLQQGIEALKKSPNLNLDVHLHINLAKSYVALDQMEMAEKNFLAGTELIDKTIKKDVVCWVYSERAKFYLDDNQLDKSIEFALKAEKLEPTKSNFIYAAILKVLYKAYYRKKQFEKAAFYFNRFDEVRDNLNIEEKAVNVEKLKIEYDYKIKEQQSEIENNRKQLKFLIAIFGLIILLLILLLIMIRYKNRLMKAKLENELNEAKENELKLALELKNKELASKTIKETEQSELINLVRKDLKEIQSMAVQTETKRALNQLVKKIKTNSSQNNWEEFDLRFSHVYESFYKKLNQIHPNLSAYDKRICALIKLNLTTKEISNISKTSVKSVENTRTRLRKKLGLTNQKIDLSKYLDEL